MNARVLMILLISLFWKTNCFRVVKKCYMIAFYKRNGESKLKNFEKRHKYFVWFFHFSFQHFNYKKVKAKMLK